MIPRLVLSGCLLLGVLAGAAHAQQLSCMLGMANTANPSTPTVTFNCVGTVPRGSSVTVTPSWASFLTPATRFSRAGLTINSPATGETRVKVAGTFQTARGRNIKTCQTRRQLSLPGGAQLDVTVATASSQNTDSNYFTGVEVLFNPLKVAPPARPTPVPAQKKHEHKHEKDEDSKHGKIPKKYQYIYNRRSKYHDDKEDEKYDDRYNDQYDERYHDDDMYDDKYDDVYDDKYDHEPERYESDDDNYEGDEEYDSYDDDNYEGDEYEYNEEDFEYYTEKFDDWEEDEYESNESYSESEYDEYAALKSWGRDVRQCTPRVVQAQKTVGPASVVRPMQRNRNRRPRTPAQLRLVVKCKSAPESADCSINQRLVVSFTGNLAAAA